MEPDSEEVFEPREPGSAPNFPSPVQGQSERLNGEGTQLQTVHQDTEEDPVGPSPDLPTDQDGGDRNSRPGDEEFENFHRSFTIGGTAMDNTGSRTAFGPPPDPGDGPDPAMATPTPSDAPANTVAVGPAIESDQEGEEEPPPDDQEPPSSPTQPLNKEDPTVVQARRSMMRRTGDRHARGKLPEPKEGRFLPPNCFPLEPQIPAPRSSKRYLIHHERPPDVFEGHSSNEDREELEEDEYVVNCCGCNMGISVSKAAVVVLCKTCGKVNPASSADGFDKSQFAPS